jgi:hypothetical protein
MSKTKGFLLAVAVATMVFTLSCSSDNDDDGRDSRLVCDDGEAWISTYYANKGSVFYKNGDLKDIEKSGSNWYFISYEDQNLKSVTWTTNGNKLIYHATSTEGRKATRGGTYRISSDGTLTLEINGQTGSFTKENGIYPAER